MKKLLEKDKKLRFNLMQFEKQQVILKFIFRNFNFFRLIRCNALRKLEFISKKTRKVAISSRCLLSINRKRYNSKTNVSRHIYFKLIKTGYISGMQKSSW